MGTKDDAIAAQLWNIKRVVARQFGLDPADLERPDMRRPVVLARQMACYLAKLRTSATHREIGAWIHQPNTAVRYSIAKVDALRNDQMAYAEMVETLNKALTDGDLLDAIEAQPFSPGKQENGL